ncbi:MAG: sugar nucleotide-binding protein [Verrucomicrobiota bacterium]|nr:sugar nucleotide-binding protein [Verrucomicrobiota bacterium]
MWGGVECTINRVGDTFHSQLQRSGHRLRLGDLDRIAELGIRTLRFPVLWEELAPVSLGSIDWAPLDAQLSRLRELSIQPIAGLVHHGSGPGYTNLLDRSFPEKLAAFARLVAERYPWIEAFTPVNEPLTTARFSGLYGHWYPHGRDGATFARAMFNECRGIVLAMRAIREITPSAVLVQTEDLGKTFSEPALQYQSDFENERRWLTWDLLCGRIDHAHPMWSYFMWLGLDESEVAFFTENPCPPDVIGVNHYVTSERYLEANLRDHPFDSHGGNGRDRYADVAAVRVRAEGLAGPAALLRETWQRYKFPLAITEAHLGCTREEQLRWLRELWSAAQTVRAEGADVRAVTAWSLLGAFDWNSLLTRSENHYESGAFDLRAPEPRPTAVAAMVRALAHGQEFAHPTLATPGWWRRPIRLVPHIAARLNDLVDESACPVADLSNEFATDVCVVRSEEAARPILIAGAGGRLAEGFQRAAQVRGLAHRLTSHEELDICEAHAVRAMLALVHPWAVINCAGFSDVDAAEANEDAVNAANVRGPETLAQSCAEWNVPLVTFSSDFAFDGGKDSPYLESDKCGALNVYGESKISADEVVQRICRQALVIRPGKIFAPFGQFQPLRESLCRLARGERVRAANDIRHSATYLPDLVNTVLDLLIDGESGVWHIVNPGSVTPEEFVRLAAESAGIDHRNLEGVPIWSLRRRALRPRNRALETARSQLLPPLADALRRFCSESPAFTEPLESLAGVR